jgi:hypothetical protein
MAVIKMNDWEASFETDYQDYLVSRETIRNEHCRSDEETIFDVFSSNDANFASDEEGQRVLEVIRNLK